MTSSPARRPAHLPLLDSVRGLAALVVVVSHSANEGFLPELVGRGFGQLGVTMFFALSGFLMAHIYLERSFSRKEVLNYAVSRGGRVLPLYYLVVGGASALLFVIGTSLYGIMTPVDVTRNLGLVRGDGVFWSIPVEIHFYVVFVALWWAWSRGHGAAAIAALLVAEVGIQVALRDSGVSVRWLFYWLHVFVAGVGLAVLHGWLQRRGALPLSGRWHLLGWAALLMTPLMPPVIRQALGIPVGSPVTDPLSVGIPLLILVCAVFALGPIRRIDTAPTRFLGRISFGIYLLHVPFLIVGRELEPWIGGVPGAQFAFVLAGTLVAATISFRLVEAPAARVAKARLIRPDARGAVVSAGGIEGTSRRRS